MAREEPICALLCGLPCSEAKLTVNNGYFKPTLQEVDAAAKIVYSYMPPTPQYCWPLLCERFGAEVWVKHENHTPVGAFKVRGGLVYFSHQYEAGALRRGVISATRGNHGQSLGFAAQHYQVPATVVVPRGNSTEKNAAMRAFGVDLIEHGEDFQEAREQAQELAGLRTLHLMPAFHPSLVAGVATYSRELFNAVTGIDTAYVPIGLGSGICGMIAVRDALGLRTKIVGVVSAHATAYLDSFAANRPIASTVSTRLADGIACRTPEPDALEIVYKGVERIIAVSDAEVAAAIRMLYECTHNVAEGAGAAAFAAALAEGSKNVGRKIAVVLSGGNVDSDIIASILGNTHSFGA